MKVHIQVSLYIVAAVALLWAVALFMAPQAIQGLFSSGPYDPAATAMFGASLFAFALLFFMAGLNPINPLVYASIIALGFLTLAALFQMFIGTGMRQNGATFFSLLLYGVIALVLFFTAVQPPAAPAMARGRPRAAARRAPGRRRHSSRGHATGVRGVARTRRKSPARARKRG
jgi:hypothetical protein